MSHETIPALLRGTRTVNEHDPASRLSR